MHTQPQAIVFDIDGTLTQLGAWHIHAELPPILQTIPLHVQLALCSGRTLERQIQRLDEILEDAPNAEEQKMRWTLITDNGSAAYRWDPKTEQWNPLFEIEWNDTIISKQILAQRIRRALFYIPQVEVRRFTVVALLPAPMYFWPRRVKQWAMHIQKRLERLFKKWGLQSSLNVESSGLGSLIFPKAVGKGKAVERWAQSLHIVPENIRCFGDSPHGNDRELLSGQYGHPTVVRGPEETSQMLQKIWNKPVHKTSSSKDENC